MNNLSDQSVGQFILSLDFELLWGVHDHHDIASYGKNILGGREAIVRMLDLFASSDIACTWATVGMLFYEDRDALLAALPPEELRPRYSNSTLSAYAYLKQLGANERTDPYHFGGSLVKRIAQTPRQEIATHTFSHYYCLEGASQESFDADIEAACVAADTLGVTLKSIVFPRNQLTPRHVAACRSKGIIYARDNPDCFGYRPVSGAGNRLSHRAARLVDTHTGILGPHTSALPAGDVFFTPPASRFLRPKSGRLARIHPLHVATIKREMTRAARDGSAYHLWWHPHNFGSNVDIHMDVLSEIIRHYRVLHGRYGMVSRAMDPKI